MRLGTLAIVASLIIVGCSSDDSASSDSIAEVSSTEVGSTDISSTAVTGSSVAESGGAPANGNDSGFSVNDEPDPATGEVEQVPPDEVVTEGTPPPTFVYTEEVEPADTFSATLCNLNSEFLRSLRDEDASGTPIVSDDLRLAVLSLSDSVSLWRELELSFPETADDVALAERVLEMWDEALLAQENGQELEAQEFMQLAEDAIDELPQLPPEGLDTCES